MTDLRLVWISWEPFQLYLRERLMGSVLASILEASHCSYSIEVRTKKFSPEQFLAIVSNTGSVPFNQWYYLRGWEFRLR